MVPHAARSSTWQSSFPLPSVGFISRVAVFPSVRSIYLRGTYSRGEVALFLEGQTSSSSLAGIRLCCWRRGSVLRLCIIRGGGKASQPYAWTILPGQLIEKPFSLYSGHEWQEAKHSCYGVPVEKKKSPPLKLERWFTCLGVKTGLVSLVLQKLSHHFNFAPWGASEGGLCAWQLLQGAKILF